MFGWFYRRRKLKFSYKLDLKGMIAIVHINKPVDFLSEKEATLVTELAAHLSEKGYLVEVIE